ncbi:MAG: hypothetical protein HEP70_15815 [Rhodobiaceae bacterium]|nr:hypothetical protein [Rhodobiaceae bacterium]
MPEFLRFFLRIKASKGHVLGALAQSTCVLTMLMLILPEAIETAKVYAELAFLGDPVEFALGVALSALALLSLQ